MSAQPFFLPAVLLLGFDLSHPHLYALLGPLLLAFALTSIYARRA